LLVAAVGANKNPVTRNICFENSKGDNGKSCQGKLPLNQNLDSHFFIKLCKPVSQRGKKKVLSIFEFLTRLSEIGDYNQSGSIRNTSWVFRKFRYWTQCAPGIFLDWFWTLLLIWKPQKQETPWNFWSRLKIPGAHCVKLVSF